MNKQNLQHRTISRFKRRFRLPSKHCCGEAGGSLRDCSTSVQNTNTYDKSKPMQDTKNTRCE